MPTKARLAILHTAPVTIQSLGALCARLLPDVEVTHYLDESILRQINRDGGLTPSVRFRFQTLIALAVAAGPDVILSACSSVGGMLEEAQALFDIPLRRIDEPMARAAAQRGGRIVVCATVASTLTPTTELLARFLPEGQSVDTLLLAEAGALLAAGDREAYLRLIASRLAEAADRYETVVLAQASMVDAAARLPQAMQGRFLTSPETGVAALANLLEGARA